MEEPSLLDYLKEKIRPRNWFRKLDIEQQFAVEPGMDLEKQLVAEPAALEDKPVESLSIGSLKRFPFISILAVLLAFLAQYNLEPARRNVTVAIALYLGAAGLLLLSLLRGNWKTAALKVQSAGEDSLTVKRIPGYLFIPLLILSFFAFSGNKFTGLNLFIWLVLIVTALLAFWLPRREVDWQQIREKLLSFIRSPQIRFSFDWRDVLLLAAFAIAAFFQFSDLNSIPNEMISDHAEKLMDVNDVLNGQTSIFFYRNTGREAFQFYLTALVTKLFGTGLSFLSLKLGTALMNLVTLVYVYKLGKELGNRWVGLLAVVLMGIAYWPNVIGRIGLRFALYPLFVAPMLFYLMRGLRSMNRNDFILAGIALGIGLQGYSPFRIVPFLVGILVIIFMVHNREKKKLSIALWGFLLVALFALVFFLPLGRYWSENPAMFGARAFTRLGSLERPLPGPALQIFLSNFWNASIMPFWSNGNVWAHSVPFRPALDVITAALYLLGVIALLFRYLRQRTWQDLALLISIPVLLMPSILSLAFPEENPALNRTSGAAVPIFIIAAIALEGFLTGLWEKVKSSFEKTLVVAGGILLIILSMLQNYDLVFRQYASMYKASSWNTSQIGEVVRDFVNSEGTVDSVWVVGIAHWVDTRAIGITSGFPAKDYAIWPESFETTLAVSGPKLFILRADDQADIDLLKAYYPVGYLVLHSSPYEGKSFYSFIVPSEDVSVRPLD